MNRDLEHRGDFSEWTAASPQVFASDGGAVTRPCPDIGLPRSASQPRPLARDSRASEDGIESTRRDANAKKPLSPHARRRTLAVLVEAITAVEEGGTLDRIAQREQTREARLRRAEANDPTEPSPWSYDDDPKRDDTPSPAGSLNAEAKADAETEAQTETNADRAPVLARIPRSVVSRGVRLQTGWPAIDRALGGGLPLGGLHEWWIDLETFGGLGQECHSSRDHFLKTESAGGEAPRCADTVGRASADQSSPRLATMLRANTVVESVGEQPSPCRAAMLRADTVVESVGDHPSPRAASATRLRPRRSPIEPPLGAIIHLLWRLLDGRCDRHLDVPASPRILWIGRRTFPHPRALLRGGPRPWHDGEFAALLTGTTTKAPAEGAPAKSPSMQTPWMDGSPRPRSGRGDPTRFGAATRECVPSRSRRERDFDRRLLEASWCLDPPGGSCEARVWAIEQAVRCRGVAAVVADGRGFRMPLTRRLHLAAKSAEAAGEPTLLLLLRDPSDANAISAASTRWQVSPRSRISSKDHADFGWSAALLRRRGAIAFTEGLSESTDAGSSSQPRGTTPFDPHPTGWTDAVSRDPPEHLEGTSAVAATTRLPVAPTVSVRPPPRGGACDSKRSPRIENDHVCRADPTSPTRTRGEGSAAASVPGGDAAVVVDRSGHAALAACAADSAQRDDDVRSLDRRGDSTERPDEPRRRSDPCLPHPHHADARPGHREVAGSRFGSPFQGDSIASRHPIAYDDADRDRRATEASQDTRRSGAATRERAARTAGAARARGRRTSADLPSLFDGLSPGSSTGT